MIWPFEKDRSGETVLENDQMESSGRKNRGRPTETWLYGGLVGMTVEITPENL